MQNDYPLSFPSYNIHFKTFLHSIVRISEEQSRDNTESITSAAAFM